MKSEATVTTLLLPAELSIYTAAELRPQWLAWAGRLPAQSTLALADGALVDQVDGAGLQLLLALQGSLSLRGCTLRLHAPSRALQAACAAIGLNGWLDALQNPTPAEAA